MNIDYARYLGPRTYSLDLTGNDLTDLSFLCYFTKLHTLVLDGNTHMFVRTLPHLSGLSTFWANNCNIKNYPEFIAVVADRFPNLKFLCILNNPGIPSHIYRSRFYSIILYRNYVINRFPWIQHLDDYQQIPR
uniref:U2A'/phosphoprotein 32 family A C-terminal domain-containing protein n=1 Tax=Phlebotomus papatasi TaxID=29031 RepID=A0A1B0EYF6_PHLPP